MVAAKSTSGVAGGENSSAFPRSSPHKPTYVFGGGGAGVCEVSPAQSCWTEAWLVSLWAQRLRPVLFLAPSLTLLQRSTRTCCFCVLQNHCFLALSVPPTLFGALPKLIPKYNFEVFCLDGIMLLLLLQDCTNVFTLYFSIPVSSAPFSNCNTSKI